MLANRTRAAEIMEREGLAALVATTPENLCYVTDVPVRFTNWTIQMYAVMPRDPDVRPAFIIPTIRLGTVAQEENLEADLYLYGDFFMEGSAGEGESSPDIDRFSDMLSRVTTVYADPAEALKAALSDLGLAGSAVGIDEMRIAPAIFARLQQELTPERVRPAYKLFREVRLIKTAGEIDRLRQASIITERAEWATTEAIAPGVHESELAQVYRLSITRDGGIPKNVTIGAGPRSAIPTIQRYFRTIKPGDLVRYDLGCELNGYQGDTGRTVIVGEPTEAMERQFRAIHAGWEALLHTIRPGVRACDVFEAGVRATRDAGIPHYRRQHVGHAIGLETYDDLILGPNDNRRLEPGMVLCIETPYYEIGFGGLQIEDTVVLMQDGTVDFLTHLDRVIFRR